MMVSITIATWVISNCHIETFMAGEYVVDLSISRRLDIYMGHNSSRIEQFSSFLVVGVLLC
jgi:hypothetical protein